jgi:hypothetical protein
VRYYALEAVSNGQIPLDHSTDLLEHQVSVGRDGVENLLERFKGREGIKKGFYNALLLFAWDAYAFSTRTVGCLSVSRRQLKSEGSERFTKSLVTEFLHKRSYLLRIAKTFDLQELV